MIYLSFVEYVLHEFLTSICHIQYKKTCFVTKNFLVPLSSLCKLYHETDCHRFDEYKQNHCGITLRLKVPQKNIPWAFFQEHAHPLIETSSRGSCNSQECDLDNLFYFKEVPSYRKTSKVYLKHPF